MAGSCIYGGAGGGGGGVATFREDEIFEYFLWGYGARRKAMTGRHARSRKRLICFVFLFACLFVCLSFAAKSAHTSFYHHHHRRQFRLQYSIPRRLTPHACSSPPPPPPLSSSPSPSIPTRPLRLLRTHILHLSSSPAPCSSPLSPSTCRACVSRSPLFFPPHFLSTSLVISLSLFLLSSITSSLRPSCNDYFNFV